LADGSNSGLRYPLTVRKKLLSKLYLWRDFGWIKIIVIARPPPKDSRKKFKMER